MHLPPGAPVPLLSQSDESYSLSISAPGCKIHAAQQWGALRALETLSQLVQWQHNDTSGTFYDLAGGNGITITDAPRFPWRGMLLDSSRNYLTTSIIKHVLDAMSYNKFNTMHWHLTDDQSWPLQSKTYPRFSEVGAYTAQAVYTHEDVQEIVGYAWERGIRVVPEFDMPAHATIWGAAYPNLTIPCPGDQVLLNPTGPVYPVLQGLLEEFKPLFNTSDYIHIGGDEVLNYKCWEQSEEVTAFMQDFGYTNYYEVRDYFEGRVQNIVEEFHSKPMVWEEVFNGNFSLHPNTVVNAWDGATTTNKAAQAGFFVVNNYGHYLDQQQPPGPSHYLWVDTWQNFYLNDPLDGTNLTPAQEKLVLGGEMSQWGEQVDATNIDSRMWPRACGGAERFWSPASYKDVTTAAFRLSNQRCRMVQRGVGAGPIRPAADYGYCFLPPTSPWLNMAEM